MKTNQTVSKIDTFDQHFLNNLYETESKGFYAVILKVASRCNLACTYCHWFRDESVYQLTGVMKSEIFDHFLEGFKIFLRGYTHHSIMVIFHGGEPLLLKKSVFARMCDELRKIQTSTQITLGVTTNGALIDDEWAQLFKKYNVQVAVSIDGEKERHDKNRITLKGKGSYDNVIRGINCLQRHKQKNLALLCVCEPSSSPSDLCDHLFNKLHIRSFDVLIPNYNQDDKEAGLVQSISQFYIELFDLWINKYWLHGVRIRILEAFVKAVFYHRTKTPGIGVCPMKTVTITPNGDMEPYDVLRINGNDQVKTDLNVLTHLIGDITSNNLWLAHLSNSLTLPTPCRSCEFKSYCRGGNTIHRYSSKNGYDNASVYCDDLKKIYAHILSMKNTLFKLGMISAAHI